MMWNVETNKGDITVYADSAKEALDTAKMMGYKAFKAVRYG